VQLRALTVVLLLSSNLAAARESMTAIAPVTTGQGAPAELQQAFSDELPRALVAAGFVLVPPNVVDMRIGERPEFLQCHAGGCLAEEATFLKVDRLLLPRLERAGDGSFTIGVTVYDAARKESICDGVDRVVTAAEVHDKLAALALKLRAELSRSGRIEVTAQPAAAVSVDGEAKGSTPWSGELTAGDHVVTLDSGDSRVERDVNVAPGATAHVDVALSAPGPRHGPLKPMKWVTLVGGVLAVGAGAALVALDGRGTCTLPSGQRQCAEVYDTRTGGLIALVGGGALVVTSVILFVVDRPRR
jgi:PEGA domain-containing protein